MSTYPKDTWAERGVHIPTLNASEPDRHAYWTAAVAKAEAVHTERPDWLTGRLLDAARTQLAAVCRTEATHHG